MKREFCPKCRLLRQMNEFTSTRTNFYRDGATKDVPVVVFSCASCNQFAMSQDAGLPTTRAEHPLLKPIKELVEIARRPSLRRLQLDQAEGQWKDKRSGIGGA